MPARLKEKHGLWAKGQGDKGKGGNTMFGGGIMGLIIIVLVGVAVYYLVMQSKNQSKNVHSSQETPMETALDILKKRFARGEITKEEFENMKREL
jgi:putative membrane protein